MHQFLKVLGQTEMDPNLTNDSKAVDFFYILENFMHETVSRLPTILLRFNSTGVVG